MADKFPALDHGDDNLTAEAGGADDSDFLSREKELMGDEFKTDQDNDILRDEDNEINDFKEQFPEVDDSAEPAETSQPQPQDDEEFEGFQTSSTTNQGSSQFEGESKHLKEWKERRDLEISEREKVNEKKKQEIVTKAQQTIDDFYDNYNNKREQHSKEILKEQESFLEKRDGFLKRGTLWDRVNEIVDDMGEVSNQSDREKTRFTGLLKKLKGNENAPGAGGY